LNKRQVK
jgi:Integrase zinc binding domain